MNKLAGAIKNAISCTESTVSYRAIIILVSAHRVVLYIPPICSLLQSHVYWAIHLIRGSLHLGVSIYSNGPHTYTRIMDEIKGAIRISQQILPNIHILIYHIHLIIPRYRVTSDARLNSYAREIWRRAPPEDVTYI